MCVIHQAISSNSTSDTIIGVQTSDVEVGDINLQTEVLCYMDLPVPNPDDPDHYLSPLAAQARSDKKSLDSSRLCLQQKMTQRKRNQSYARRSMIKGKKFTTTKSRSLAAKCDDCGSSRCIYSTHASSNDVCRSGQLLKGLQLTSI